MQTIFITGASSGLGKTTARLFQANGWKVIATMRNPEKETELGLLENVTLLPMDVTNPDQVTQTVQKAVTLGVDVVLNNAGYGLVGGFEAYTDQQIRKQLETNLLGVLRVSQPFITYFREQKKGDIPYHHFCCRHCSKSVGFCLQRHKICIGRLERGDEL